MRLLPPKARHSEVGFTAGHRRTELPLLRCARCVSALCDGMRTGSDICAALEGQGFPNAEALLANHASSLRAW